MNKSLTTFLINIFNRTNYFEGDNMPVFVFNSISFIAFYYKAFVYRAHVI